MTAPLIGRLYIVATPIGNPRDITLRAMDILQQVDAVICEEQREGSTLLKKLGISKEILLLNEHNEAEVSALISDCGTPVFADPGAALIAHLTGLGIPIVPIPGPSSLMAALSILDVKLDRFFYAGFLPRDKEERRKALKYLRNMRVPLIIMDAPYRLVPVLEDIKIVFGDGANLTCCIDLTLPGESILRGPLKEISRRVGHRKGEFVLIIH
jgi:16S rRNA (cytidine1402-2'-O)-methyltransferase